MKKGALIVVVIFLISITIVSSGEDKVSDEIEEKLLSQDKVNVIVVLKEKQEIRTEKLSRKSLTVEKTEIKELVLKKLDEKDFEKKRDFGSFNGFSGEITKDGLEKLKLDENVEKIEYLYPVKAFLQDSIPLINASIAHTLQLNGINITGQDQTVCLIDTGINYNHQDLGGCFGEGCKVVDGYDFVNNDNDPMDDEGHGTHVAGIIASSNSGIPGVGPNIKLVALKTLDENGTGSPDDLISAIEWCTYNSTLYNISVISMSLGDGQNYSTYCDNEQSTYAASINVAIANNITVVVAAGNEYNYTAVSSPACIENATAVSATDKNDDIAGYSSRAEGLTDLLAPGTFINSTNISGDYVEKSGTSMATPHVAGAFALLRQFSKLQNNRILTPQEIQNTLNNSGKIIVDSSGTGYSFSRIDVYEAILDLDDGAPEIDINLNLDVVELTQQQNLTINIVFSDSYLDSNFSNVTYPNGTLLIEFNDNLELTNENLSELGTYEIIAWANDTNGNENLTSKTFLVQDTTSLNEDSFTLNYPEDENITGNELIYFNVTIGSKYNLSNITLYHNFTDWSANESFDLNINETSVEFNSSFSDGIYLWGVEACDINNYCNFSNNRTFIVDLTNPIVNADSYSNSTNNVVLHYNVTDYNISDCRLFINDELNESDDYVDVEIDQTFSKFLYNGDYNWSVNCTDRVGLTGISDTIFMNVACTESWSCTDWSPSTCPESQQQTRTCTDSNNCGTENSKPVVSQSCTYTGNVTSDSDGSSPSPGGAATTTIETESVLIFSGLANDIKTFGISKDVGIEGISVTLKNAVTNAKLSVKKLDSNPTSISLDNIYKYIQIDKSGITDDDIKEAVIKFKVEKNWINTNAAGVNYVYMQRYNNGKWEKLETLTAGSDDNYQKYQANTLGFSYFAVNAEKAIPLPSLGSSEESSGKETINSSENNISNKTSKGLFNFKNLFSGNVVSNLRDKIGKIEINLFSKGSIYNILFVIIVFLMLLGVTYKYREVILTGVRKPKKNIKFKEKDLAVKRRFFIFKRRVKDIEKKEVKGILDKIKDLEEVKDNKLKSMKEGRAAKLKIKEEEKTAKIKIEEAERAANLRAKEEARIAKENAEKAKLERFEVKDKSDEKWEDFDMESDWDEGD